MESLANDPRFSRCWTRIDLDTIAQNYENARALCRSQLIPVLKADAYGMGAVRVARVLMARGAKLFAVATHAEAMELKNALPCDVLVMGLVGEAELDEAIARGVILAVFSLEYARAVSAHAKARPARVHFKVDTGLHRLGFSSLEVKPIVDTAIEKNLIAHGAGHLVYRLAKETGMSIREAGLCLSRGEKWDEVAKYFEEVPQ